MTIAKPTTTNNTSPKPVSKPTEKIQVAAKRSSSLSGSFKFAAPSTSKAPFQKYNADQGLQSIDTRRKYMRRGSRCPSMLMLFSGKNIQELASSKKASTDSYNENVEMVGAASAPPSQSHQQEQQQRRRMSLMSALKYSLEQTSIVDSNTVHDYSIMSTDERRKSTYELLSQI
uniref:Uncharacterized protein n=1 Tax=Entomoneis paludosa TaxID=265537 RepID=A0A6U2YCM5_9STRA|mmetsp:Transcript_16363/g.33786  ORF Transcript_16363/g.33786 Transcript_16363/m.33786 type:complete len:173 (+) Transcript_16363:94-612(+)|eukprot:CAMPEP_0172439166 /NCGR_PEP_ID=MMETSP1065-20121228/241_1 /TAXON_ID=265537 /ORGANISM="Amphiprora paludosa, Strain CCMP125" /LENGTH=172 /DNA_ID=CAMNT_0013187809 /DNA_START=93 /DNA_END=611 /DNA_ORIENTATION=-